MTPSVKRAVRASDLRPSPAELLTALARIGRQLACATCDRDHRRADLAPCSHDACRGERHVYCGRCRAHWRHV